MSRKHGSTVTFLIVLFAFLAKFFVELIARGVMGVTLVVNKCELFFIELHFGRLKVFLGVVYLRCGDSAVLEAGQTYMAWLLENLVAIYSTLKNQVL
uniref:Uncharacterized protein n=1 Tax=Glossina palpalis gambiensis TaxID=67801 RepID=A0A1B0ARZ0_9MUSC